MTAALEVLMLLCSLLLVIGGIRAQRVHGAALLSIGGVAVVFAIVFYAGGVRDIRVAVIIGVALLFAALLYARAYRRSHSPGSV